MNVEDELHRPLRLRVARRISNALTWLVRNAPGRVNWWLTGPDHWQPRCCVWTGATVCRLLGHDWQTCVSGEGRTHTLFMCSGCQDLWAADDYLAFDPDTRDGRDTLALAAWDYLPVLEERHDQYVGRAREVIRRHAEQTIRRAVEEHAEASDELEPEVYPFSPSFADYDLWEAAGLDWKAIREGMEAPVRHGGDA